MAKRKHLINAHTSTGTTAPSGASLYLGEIAVQHTPNDPALWIKVGTSQESTDYEKFIGLTEIANLIENNKTLGSGYTYSGISYVNSSTSIADAYSALTKELIDDEYTLGLAINALKTRVDDNELTFSGAIIDINDRIDNLSFDAILGSGYTYSGIPYVNSATSIADAYSALTNIVLENKELTENAIDGLSSDISGLTEDMSGLTIAVDNLGDIIQEIAIESKILGSGYTYSGIPYVNSSTTIADAYSALTMEMKKDEYTISTAINDLYDSVDNLNNSVDSLSDSVDNLYVIISGISPEAVLGPDYTYSGIPYVNSSTTIAAAYSALTEELIKDEYTTAGAINDIYQVISGISPEAILGPDYTYSGIPYVNSSTTVAAAYSALTEELLNDEEVTSNALNDLNDRVDAMDGSTIILGSGYTYSGVPYVNCATTIAAAFSAITKGIVEDEAITSAALNDLYDGLSELSGASVNVSQLNSLSGTIVNLSAGTVAGLTNIEDELDDYAEYTELLSLSASVVYLSSNTVANVTGADVLLTGYELASGSSEAELVVTDTDTVNEAIGKLQKQNYDNEAVIAGILNDIDARIIAIEQGASGGGGANVAALSAATVAHIADTTVHLPAVTSSDNGKVLQVVNGVWTLVSPSTVYSGSNPPEQSLGNNGDIYLQS